ncbi:MAG: hypothetical protein LBK08_09795 [Treponema sp.]|jgi:hypothetical protein|nr:hypothetical protein [Treponema sp.]
MKFQKPLAAAVVFSGIVIIFLVCVFTTGLHDISLALSRLFGSLWSSNAFMYAAAALVPLLAGALMLLVIFFVSRREEKEFAERLQAARKSADEYCGECMQRLDSMNASIARIRESSEKLKRETEKLFRLNQRLKNHGSSSVESISGETPAILEEYLFKRTSVLYAGETALPELFQFPQFHHRE